MFFYLPRVGWISSKKTSFQFFEQLFDDGNKKVILGEKRLVDSCSLGRIWRFFIDFKVDSDQQVIQLENFLSLIMFTSVVSCEWAVLI